MINEANIDCFDWTFHQLFSDIDTKLKFVQDVLNAFEEFPSETRLNCDDFYSILSLVCSEIPYSFVAFVCECVDPSISSKTILSHRIHFGNFLLAFPCCIIYPYFMHELLTLFKTTDIHRKGIIKRDNFLIILSQIYSRFVPQPKDPKDKSDSPPPPPEEELVGKINGFEKRYPDPHIVEDYFEATMDFNNSSVQTLLFVMWQKDEILLNCKDRISQDQMQAMKMDDEQQNNTASINSEDTYNTMNSESQPIPFDHDRIMAAEEEETLEEPQAPRRR